MVELTTRVGDITRCQVDAIVNAANSSLLGGGGVDGAIHRGAGPELLTACRAIRRDELPGGLPVGQAVITPGFALPARFVIHTVGPNWHAGERDPRMLASCVTSSLDLAAAHGLQTVAFPAISSGVFGWDGGRVARIMVSAAREWAASSDKKSLTTIEFITFSDNALAQFQAALGAQPTPEASEEGNAQ